MFKPWSLPAKVNVLHMKSLSNQKRITPIYSGPSLTSVPQKLEQRSLAGLRRAARDCRACDLWKNATQTVFGEGPPRAKIVFVGEQPGDQEDLAGHPFVGPAGKILDEALDQAGID
ncbi:MAG TPA: uracil-DNA glycosylase family protein, partial [Candidatus Acidoferrum sp.]|nr:uracil-DNA glycosylase family protein [Candidatus Acidoferrum sp.]